MDIQNPIAVVGTNSWGSALYEKAIRGEAVDDSVIKAAVAEAVKQDLLIFDTAQDYGFGKGQKMIGDYCPAESTLISAKYTPGSRYKENQVHISLEKDLKDFGRDRVDIYWLHLPNCVEENMAEIIDLYKAGKIRYVGISNFNLQECIQVKKLLDEAGVPLYGVQNHFSLLDRTWEESGLTKWCQENGISFWAWAVLEEGILAGPKKKEEKFSIMKAMFNRRRRKLRRLFGLMNVIAKRHNITIAQVAIAYVANKGLVPICGCRKPYQVEQLKEAAETKLSVKEMNKLEEVAAESGTKILGADMFRFAVKKTQNPAEIKTKTAGSDRHAEIKKSYKLLGSMGSIYDGIVSYSTLPGKLMNKLMWGFNSETTAEWMNWAMSGVPENFTGKLLEVPVGTGVLTMPLYKSIPQADITCLDYSADMMENAKKRAKVMGVENVSFVQGDVGHLPFEDESFDIVMSLNGFHAFPDKEAAYRETYRVLKKGGIFCGCFYIEGGAKRTDWVTRHIFVPKGAFTPPFETAGSLEKRLDTMYEHVSFHQVKAIGTFVCRK